MRLLAMQNLVGSNPINRSMVQIIYVFLAAFVLGFLYSYYIRRTAHAQTLKKQLQAASSGSVLYLLGAVIVISYVSDPWLLIPACVGDWLGSLLQLRIDMNKEQYEENLRRIQKQHLENIQKHTHWQPCMHDQCTECHGTGMKLDGTPCVHGISCPCPKCSPRCNTSTLVT